MLRQFLGDLALLDLPLIATGIFIAFFVAVLIRVSQRSRMPEYDRMASLPLQEDSKNGDHQ